jgi:carnitine 3-dehydrogenase
MEHDQTTRKKIALIGLGTVGLGWAATYLANGYDVDAYDPDASADARAANFLKDAWPALRSLGLAKSSAPPMERLTVLSDAAKAIHGAAIVHENGPESLVAKHAIFSQIEAHANDETMIASSSGGLPPSDLQAQMRRPDRMLIAHPFNPPHLVPLVEVIGGSKTSSDVIQAAMDHLRSLGKHPIRVDKELPGYLTNRLQFALLREAIHCLIEGIAPLESIEDSVRYGLAPRWLAMGSLTTLTLAGGPGGMDRVLHSFAGAIEGWWEALGTPQMTPEAKRTLAAAGAEIVAERGIGALIKARDEALVPILKTLSSIDESTHAKS